METDKVEKKPFACAYLDHQDLSLLVESLELLLIHRVYKCDDKDVIVLFDLLSHIKKLKDMVQGPF